MEENLKQTLSDGVIRIVLCGPASTGKTTLAKQLAQHFQTSWAPEFARQYLENKWQLTGSGCSVEDVMQIAVGQLRMETQAMQEANRFVFADTSLLSLRLLSELTFGVCDPVLEKASRKNRYDLFLVTDADVPQQREEWRPSLDRTAMADALRKALTDFNKPYVVLSGDEQTRFKTAVSLVESLEKALKAGFTSHDFLQLYKRGIRVENAIAQLGYFRNGIRKMPLARAATVDDGIVKLNEEEFDRYAGLFDSHRQGLNLAKFVPASGAASRMFKFLSEFLQNFRPATDTINSYINRNNASSVVIFLAGLEKFPFYRTLISELEALHPGFSRWSSDARYHKIIEHLLSQNAWDFCNKPKGVLPFHQYDDHIATAVEEHLNETVHYATGRGNVCNLHFTVSEHHRSQFEAIVDRVKGSIEKLNQVSIDVSFSYQHGSTDTLAVQPDNQPFRMPDGSLLFRPGGHGALIENLNRLDADVIFVKNIDNVIQNHVLEIGRYKKALAGLLIELQQQISSGLAILDSDNASEEEVMRIVTFMEQKLNIGVPSDFGKYALPYKMEFIREALNRPIRVCGMVRNEGEPGGGPFWVRNENGKVSLQIVESSQVDLTVPAQAAILQSATHFNPVDLVCGVRDSNGNKYDLTKFVDPDSGFIAEKTKAGKPLRAYELPGLWNGGMANWITVFVEVPLMTFNPVKTVNDLLKPAHQPL